MTRCGIRPLLLLPRTTRLRRVRGDDVRNPVQQAAEMTTHVGVPRVGVGNVGIRGVRRHLQINAKGLQRRVGIRQAAWDTKGRRVIARFTEAVDVSFDELPQLRDEVFDMDSGPP